MRFEGVHNAGYPARLQDRSGDRLPDIFISYARSDRARVATIAAGLAAEGFDVWWDPKIEPGETFRGGIEKALTASKCVVVIWSKDSVKRNWVIEEAQEGLDRQMLVPILLDDVVNELPRGFKSVQAADLRQWRGGRDDPNWQVVKARITSLTQPSSEPATTAFASASVLSYAKRISPRILLAVALLLVATVAAGVYAYRAAPTRGDQEQAAPGVATKGFKDCGQCPEMVEIPAGSFLMGSPPSEEGRFPNEAPQHPVTIKAFAAGRFEVTWDEWNACVGAGSCPSADDLGWGGGRLPAINVSWTDVQSYLAWLRRVTGKDYRLLSEAEWEYAARAGTTGRYSFGDSEAELCAYANGADQSAKTGHADWQASSCSDGFARTAPAGSLKPNKFGLYDMHGNVWEWVQDCFVDSYADAASDGAAASSGDCSIRTLRGGAWYSTPSVLRSASRGKAALNTRSFAFGFRVGRSLGTP